MTQQEFTQRVNVEVSNKEFEAINEVYMNSDLDKDEFCKMWVKMNKTRVQNAKVERMIKAKDEAYRDALHKFYTKNNDVNEFMTPICYVKISVYEIQGTQPRRYQGRERERTHQVPERHPLRNRQIPQNVLNTNQGRGNPPH